MTLKIICVMVDENIMELSAKTSPISQCHCRKLWIGKATEPKNVMFVTILSIFHIKIPTPPATYVARNKTKDYYEIHELGLWNLQNLKPDRPVNQASVRFVSGSKIRGSNFSKDRKKSSVKRTE